MHKTNFRDISVRKLNLQDFYKQNQGLKHNFHKNRRANMLKTSERTSGAIILRRQGLAHKI
jgi:hypothetical protein